MLLWGIINVVTKSNRIPPTLSPVLIFCFGHLGNGSKIVDYWLLLFFKDSIVCTDFMGKGTALLEIYMEVQAMLF